MVAVADFQIAKNKYNALNLHKRGTSFTAGVGSNIDVKDAQFNNNNFYESALVKSLGSV